MSSEQDRQNNDSQRGSSQRQYSGYSVRSHSHGHGHSRSRSHSDSRHSKPTRSTRPIDDEDYVDWSATERITKVDDGGRKRLVALGGVFILLVALFVAFDKIIKSGNRVVPVGDVTKSAKDKTEEESPAPEPDLADSENGETTAPDDLVASSTPASQPTSDDETVADDLEIPPFDQDEPLAQDDATSLAQNETKPEDGATTPNDDENLLAENDEPDPDADDEPLPELAENDLSADDVTLDNPEIGADPLADPDNNLAADLDATTNLDDAANAELENADPIANLDDNLAADLDAPTNLDDVVNADLENADPIAGGDDDLAADLDAPANDDGATNELDDAFANAAQATSGAAPSLANGAAPQNGDVTGALPEPSAPTTAPGDGGLLANADAPAPNANGAALPASNAANPAEDVITNDLETPSLANADAVPGPAPSSEPTDASAALADDAPTPTLPSFNDANDLASSTTNAANDGANAEPDDALLGFGDPEPLEPETDVLADENDPAPLDVEETPVVDLDQARADLAQLEFQFRQLVNDADRDVDDLLDALDEPLTQTQDFVQNAPTELAGPASALLEKIEGLRSDLESNLDFYRSLEKLDAASLDGKNARDFFAPWRNAVKPENASKPGENASERVEGYKQDFARAAEALDAIDVVDKWNVFMQENGERLEQFHVSQADAKLGVKFIAEFRVKPGVPEEMKSVEKREPQWRFDSERQFPTQRKIVLEFEKEVSQRYWTYAPSRDVYYYLPSPPHRGENTYVASAAGALAKVTIPADAPELQTDDSPQKQALREFEQMARDIPDSLRDEDVALWYRKWSEFIQKLIDAKDVDPIIQYKTIQQIVLYLKTSDYYFSTPLDPILRVLNVPQIDSSPLLDRFPAETAELRSLRNLAISRVDSLPQDQLKVDKTTDELNAKVERFATLYRRVGWLDKGFNGEWRLRKPDDAQTPAGDLYVLYAETQGLEPKWFKIGSSDGRQVTLNVASESIPRGSIVLCRIPLTRPATVATRSSVDALFTR